MNQAARVVESYSEAGREHARGDDQIRYDEAGHPER